MRKLLVLLLLTTLISCSDSDNDSNIPQQLIGKWQYVEFITDYVEFDQNGNPIRYYITDGFIIEFKSNGTFTSNEVDGFPNGTYKINNNIIVLSHKTGNQILKKYRLFHYTPNETEILYLTPSIDIPITEGMGFYDSYIMSKI